MKKFPRYQTLAVFFIAMVAFLMASNSYAFDGERKGFFFSFGLGPGYASYSQTYDSAGTELNSLDESKFSVWTNFNIGYAPSNKLMIYWMNKVAWFSLLDSTVSKDNITYATSVGGPGITYFFNEQAPSLYINFGGGLAARSQPFKGSDPWIGFGLAGGIGYEVSRNWAIELSILYGKGKDDYTELNQEWNSDAFAVGLNVNIIAY